MNSFIRFFLSILHVFVVKRGRKLDDWRKGGQMERKLFTCISGVSCEGKSEEDVR